MHKRIVLLGIKHKESLVQHDVNGMLTRAIKHELCSRFADHSGCRINELARPFWNAQVDSACFPAASRRRHAVSGDRGRHDFSSFQFLSFLSYACCIHNVNTRFGKYLVHN
jgi:hypothetical protein